MIRKLISTLAIAFVAGCAGTPAEVENMGEGQEAISAAAVSGDDTQSATCPPAGTCAKADANCIDPVRDAYWCNILDQCLACGGIYAAPTEETAAVVAGGDTQSATCPPAGTCAKADINCEDPQTDIYWCGILDQCLACLGLGTSGEQTQ